MPAPNIPQIRLYQDWLRDTRGLDFDHYDALWRWSVTELDAFWQSIWDYARIESPTPHTAVLAESRMPLARWFPGAQVNYAREVLRHADAAHAAGMPAIVSDNERGEVRELSWPEMRRQVASVALTLKSLGVKRGDRVAAYMPNVPETMVAFLACSSIGAIWSVCAPDMGTAAVADRFRQIEPTLLIAVDGVHYGGKPLDRSAVLQELRGQLPSVRRLLLVPSPHATGQVAHDVDWARATARDDAEVAAFEPEWLPFDHPIWIVYSSGTTGLPKPIVHGQGGIILTMHACGLHNDVGASYGANNFGERYHWYSSTGWVMWNSQLSGLAFGATICIYDGNPAGSKEKPDWGVLWRFVARHQVTFFGAGAAYFSNCMKAGLVAKDCGDLSRVRALGSTGSPLPEEVQRWGTRQLREAGSKDVWWCNISGGTDFCGAFVGGHRELPEVPGQMQCRELGHAVEAWNEQGQPVIGEVGELVCTQPIPSMPLYFWGDEGNARYVSSYFDTYPGVWRHGDWIRIGSDGGCIIYGRSDATINRQGLRMGTSEIYSAVEGLPEVLDSMVVDLEYLGRESYMPLFVVLRPGVALDDAVRARLNHAIKTSLSPRFVPNDIFQVAEIPRTLSGKKQELPIKKLLLGQPIEKVVNREAMANPGSLDWYVAFAAQRASV
ncbi:acetoacetyl-CoA synthetase [Variovorax paradoxus]|jgi:acetoacetyl-CoA synthetase|uniref:acetoacetate--CoA ligase n=1 Tax=Variovorax paradoxus TaxID=34073 RepID=UPI0006E5F59B|nr:acetoacetyl-CoA synthetase [Variovorax paradoxus]KPV06509.1 acetoacetyl-CoA synthetase [Variovorax paradoxus]KPV08415.1 acetoacetyl-CoA synthetase [Variovorax paradoxus]KPV21981.1 acetoacetyl-CoA synthetase [Variovorax paradoxus]KPV32002.1 acetoacetyl-CoA synthetase [Variovorax paradoxus]